LTYLGQSWETARFQRVDGFTFGAFLPALLL
jgi:hypothetical protein